MSDFLALDISGAGMAAQRMRMRVISENLANQHTTGPNGPYQRKEVVMESSPIKDFSDELTGALQQLSTTDGKDAVSSVKVSSVSRDGSEPVRVYDPSHPHADAQGYVAYPNISIFREMTDMVEASRSYEANLAASKATQQMLNGAIEMLR
ncbi:flagellar basal body rod protein FlgC [bacterium]|nr:flagellar basal body rod protein FlgC [bacterium]